MKSIHQLEIIRKFSWLHTELVPYMYNYVVTANQGGRVLQKPIEGKYQYLFVEDLLIAPIYEDALEREVNLPEGKWRYWFDDKMLITGPAKLKKKFPLDEFPVFVKEGAIIPMHISRPYTNIGDSSSANFTTWVIYPAGKSEFTIYDTQTQSPTTLHVAAQPGQITLQLTGQAIPSIFNIHSDKKPIKISSGAQVLVEGVDYQYDVKKKRIVVKTGGDLGRVVVGF